MPVKTAVVGAGRMGDEHLGQLRTIPDAEVVALMDPIGENAREISEKHGITGVYHDLETMLAVTRPEYVIVASPPKYHAEQAIVAMESGAHVLVEKPLCVTIEEAEAIEATAKREGRLFTMGVQRRQSRSMRSLKQFLDEGILGDIYHSRVWGGTHYELCLGTIPSPKRYVPGWCCGRHNGAHARCLHVADRRAAAGVGYGLQISETR